MEPVLCSSFNVADAARILFSKSVINECHKMVEEQKPALFSVLRDMYGDPNRNLRNGRNKAFTVPMHLRPSNEMTWPSIFSININDPTPSDPKNRCVRPPDALAYILGTYDADHRTYCQSLCENCEFYVLCTDGSCMICLRCRQWILVYKILDDSLVRGIKEKVRFFFSEFYIPTFFLLISREVRTTSSILISFFF